MAKTTITSDDLLYLIPFDLNSDDAFYCNQFLEMFINIGEGDKFFNRIKTDYLHITLQNCYAKVDRFLRLIKPSMDENPEVAKIFLSCLYWRLLGLGTKILVIYDETNLLDKKLSQGEIDELILKHSVVVKTLNQMKYDKYIPAEVKTSLIQAIETFSLLDDKLKRKNQSFFNRFF